MLIVTSGHAVFAQQKPEPAVVSPPLDKSVGKDTEKSKVTENQDDDDDDDDEDDDARFKQPVRVGDLIDRAVIAPVESQDVLGSVRKVVRNGDDVTIVMARGGYFGFGARLICVPSDVLALTGHAIQAKEITTAELDSRPTCDGGTDTPIDLNASIKMNLAKPAH